MGGHPAVSKVRLSGKETLTRMAHAFDQEDERFLQRALQLAGLGGNRTSPNPLVGAVVVKHGKIIGEGYHTAAGCPHAEPEAIARIADPHDLKGATLYVTLEPCNHFGKTPPCTDLIIRSGISRVVIGTGDPNPQVNGIGIKKLLNSGIEVILAPDPKPYDRIIQAFTKGILTQKARVILKWAESSNGLIGYSDQRILISERRSQIFTHRLRQANTGILLGAGTILVDNPRLDTRLVAGHNPTKIVLDPQGRIPSQHPFFQLPGKKIYLNAQNTSPDIFQSPEALLAWLYQVHQINSVLVEGGAFVLNWFLKANCWDEIYRIVSANSIPETDQAVKAPEIVVSEMQLEIHPLGKDAVWHYTRRENSFPEVPVNLKLN